MGRRIARSAGLLGALALLGPVACAEIIGAEFGDYTEVDGDDAGEPGDGGSAQGGGGRGSGGNVGGRAVGTGGRQPLGSGGRLVGSGGTPIGPGGGGGPGCLPGQKQCGAVCSAPNPGVGCGLLGCTPCAPPPASAFATCMNTQCAFECFVGYRPNGSGNGCEPEPTASGGASGAGGTPGSGGSAGSTGGSGTCVPANCPACSTLIGPFKCCAPNGTCGCSWISSGAACT